MDIKERLKYILIEAGYLLASLLLVLLMIASGYLLEGAVVSKTSIEGSIVCYKTIKNYEPSKTQRSKAINILNKWIANNTEDELVPYYGFTCGVLSDD